MASHTVRTFTRTGGRTRRVDLGDGDAESGKKEVKITDGVVSWSAAAAPSDAKVEKKTGIYGFADHGKQKRMVSEVSHLQKLEKKRQKKESKGKQAKPRQSLKSGGKSGIARRPTTDRATLATKSKRSAKLASVRTAVSSTSGGSELRLLPTVAAVHPNFAAMYGHSHKVWTVEGKAMSLVGTSDNKSTIVQVLVPNSDGKSAEGYLVLRMMCRCAGVTPVNPYNTYTKRCTVPEEATSTFWKCASPTFSEHS